MKQPPPHPVTKFFTCCLAIAVILMAVATGAYRAEAAELVMFEQAGCPWCQVFDRQIGPIYPKTDEGHRAPLRRVNINGPTPPDLKFIQMERLTPLFVLVDHGREIGRIRGYPGEDNFWGLLDELVKRLDRPQSGIQPVPPVKISLKGARLND